MAYRREQVKRNEWVGSFSDTSSVPCPLSTTTHYSHSRDESSPDAPGSLSCPTCAQWSDVCCQVESGPRVLGGLVRANTRAVWNTGLLRALARLRYQVSAGSSSGSGSVTRMSCCRASCVRGCWCCSPMIRGSRSSRRVNIAPC